MLEEGVLPARSLRQHEEVQLLLVGSQENLDLLQTLEGFHLLNEILVLKVFGGSRIDKLLVY